jgi:hypothetical protein
MADARPAKTDAARLSLRQQSQMVEALVGRCVMRGGGLATEAVLVLTADDVENLLHLADRLVLLAPHEAALRKLVGAR